MWAACAPQPLRPHKCVIGIPCDSQSFTTWVGHHVLCKSGFTCHTMLAPTPIVPMQWIMFEHFRLRRQHRSSAKPWPVHLFAISVWWLHHLSFMLFLLNFNSFLLNLIVFNLLVFICFAFGINWTDGMIEIFRMKRNIQRWAPSCQANPAEAARTQHISMYR